jgi:hypothetical protein
MSEEYVLISYSKDHGHTWTHERKFALAPGDDGNYLRRVRFQRIGRCQQIMFRIRNTGGPFTIISGHADVQVGI